MRLIPASGIRTIFDQAKKLEQAGHCIIHLDLGLPLWPPPPGALESLQKAHTMEEHQYTENRGLLELRHLWSEEIKASAGITYDPETELIVTAGASEGVAVAELGILEAGDEIIVPQPAWGHYDAVGRLANATVVPLELSLKTGYQIDPERLKKVITPRTKMVVINSPSNPTGVIQEPERLKTIAELANHHGFFVLTDEVYDHFVYEKPHVSIARCMKDSEKLIYLNSLSKTYAITGWRLGILGARQPVLDALHRVHQHLTVCAPSLNQRAAIEFLKHPERQKYLNEMKTAFYQKAQLWSETLKECVDLEFIPPQGAFYVFPSLTNLKQTAQEFCMMMLQKHLISIVPGDAFGPSYRQSFRISFGGPWKEQEEAAEKLKQILRCR